MADRIWTGDAVPVAQVVKAIPAGVEPGDLFVLTINGKDVSYAAQAASAADVVAGLVAAINESTIPEFQEIEAADVDGEYLTLTARTPGVPFTVTADAQDAGGFNVEVTTIQQGIANTEEVQQVRIPVATSGGTFTLSFAGQTTAAIAFDAPATGLGSVQEALEALSTIDPGDVTVTKPGTGRWLVEFGGQFSGSNVPTLIGDGTNLTGAATITVQTTQDGSPVLNQIYETTIGPGNFSSSVHNWRATVDGIDGDTHFDFPNGDAIRAAIESRVGAGNVTVQFLGGNVDDASNPATYRIEFIGAWGGRAVAYQLTLASASFSTTTTEIQAGNSTGPSEIQTVTVNDGPKAGTWTLTFQGQTTSALAHNADAATVLAALEALSNIGAGNVAVTKSGNVFTVTFQGTLASQDVQQMTADASSLTGGNVYADTIQTAVNGRDEAQRISFSQQPSAGTFTLTYDGQTTAGIAWNATAAAVESALEALANIDNVTVSGEDGGPWTVVFAGSLARTDVGEMTGDGTNLSGTGGQTLAVTIEVASRGPNHWDDPDNWTGNAVPVNGDNVYFFTGETACLYGLDQSGVTLAKLEIDSRYTANIGLPIHNANDYYEYRERYLKIGATTIIIGKGPGSGSQLLRIDTGAVQTTLTVHLTGGGFEPGLPALLWKGTHVANVLVLHDGDVGVALVPTESANLSGGITQHGGTLLLGAVTVTGDIKKTGGILQANDIDLTGTLQILA